MARKYSTLRTRFVQRKLVAKTNFFKVSAQNPTQLSGQTASILELKSNSLDTGFKAVQSTLALSTLLNDILPATMETLRSHVNYLLSLPLPVGEKNRLLLKYWAMECRLEAVRLLLDEAQASGIGLGEDGVDLSCFDLSSFGLTGFDLSRFDLAGFHWADDF